MAGFDLGVLEVVARSQDSDPFRAREQEVAAIDYFDRRFMAALERRAAEYGDIARELVGAITLPADVELAFIDDHYSAVSYSGGLNQPAAYDPVGGGGAPLPKALIRLERDGEPVIVLMLDDIVLRPGSTIRSASVRAGSGPGGGDQTRLGQAAMWLLNIVAAAIVGGAITGPFFAPMADTAYDPMRAEVMEDITQVSSSPCELRFDYRPDIGTMRKAVAETYRFIDTSDSHEHRRRVCNLQVALKVIGHDPGPIDGAYGIRTKAAWAAFRKANGLSGKVDDIDYFKLADAFRDRLEERMKDR